MRSIVGEEIWVEVNGEEKKAIHFEYVEGETLEEILIKKRESKERLDTRTAIDYTLQMLSGLGFIHDCGIRHRDMGTHNIMVTEEGKIKIIDFGLSGSGETEDLLRYNRSYGAPELKLGLEEKDNVDLFSVGLMFYEMLAGEHLAEPSDPHFYDGLTDKKEKKEKFKNYVAEKIYSWAEKGEIDEFYQERIYSLKKVIDVSRIPQTFEEEIKEKAIKVINGCLTINSEERYQSAEEVIGDLKRVADWLNLGDPIKVFLKYRMEGQLEKYKRMNPEERKYYRRKLGEIDKEC